MSSVSSPHPNLNPTSNSNPSSSSTQSTKPRNPKSRNKNKNKTPNWLELPEDIWSLIFSKLYTIHLIENVQKVCMLFRNICKQPSLYKVVNLTLPDAFMDLTYNANVMTKHIVDRSCGELVDIYLEYVCDDNTLMYIVERSKNLKHLRLGHDLYISDHTLIDSIKKLPNLEEIELIICSYSEETIEVIGHACPSLKSFTLNNIWSKHWRESENEEALAIAKSMPNLLKLQLIGNSLDNKGLKAILDGCPNLESLDIRACFRVDLSGDLAERCGKIKHLRLPHDSTEDYGHSACTDSEHYMGLDSSTSRSSDNDSDNFYGFYPEYRDIDEHEDEEFLDYLYGLGDFEYGDYFDCDSSD